MYQEHWQWQERIEKYFGKILEKLFFAEKPLDKSRLKNQC